MLIVRYSELDISEASTSEGAVRRHETTEEEPDELPSEDTSENKSSPLERLFNALTQSLLKVCISSVCNNTLNTSAI